MYFVDEKDRAGSGVGFERECCRRQIQRARNGAAVKICVAPRQIKILGTARVVAKQRESTNCTK